MNIKSHAFRALSLCAVVAFAATTALAQNLTTLGWSTGPRFTLTDKTWPANDGDAEVCLWKDDAHAAVSITSDVTGGLLDWWQDIGDTYDIGITWFVITWQMDNDTPKYPDWDTLAAIHANGHDIQSHSVTHFNVTRGFDVNDPDHNQYAEYRDSQIAIETNLGIPCLTIAYPGGSGYSNYPDQAMDFFIAGRGTASKINKAAEIDYPQTNSVGDGLQIDESTTTWRNLSNLFDPSHYGYRGWYVTHYHGISEEAQAKIATGLDYLATKDAEVGIWNCWYRHGAQYAQERDSATLTTNSVTSTQITLTLTDLMLDSLFDYPLTIKVRMPAAWATCVATQGGQSVGCEVITHNGDDYALVQAVPDGGSIVLTESGGGGGNVPPTADAGAPQTVADTDDGGDEDVTLDGSGSADSDGTITSYVWEENSSQIATGVGPTVTLSVGAHIIDLTVTDDDSDTDSDSVGITVDPAPSGGASYVVDCDTDDQVVHESGTFRSVTQTDARVGYDQSSLEGSYVMVFELPTLAAGETVSDANLDVYLELISSGMVGNVDLYGLSYRSSSAVVAGDFYHGSYDGDAGATALQDDICVLTTSVGAIESSSSGDSNLATYLAAQYTAGATGGDYVFIRLSSDYVGVPDYKYYRFTTANDTSTDTPVLTIITGSGGGSNDAPIADAGADQSVTDTDSGGDESVTLDGSGSTDSDGTIASYVWEENLAPIATGVSPTVTLDVNVHMIDLTVTDDDDDTDTDTVVITVNAGPPPAGSTYVVDCDTADQVVHESGTFRSVTQMDARVGYDQSSLEGSYVMVFELPTLAAGETVSDANLDVYLELITSGMVGNVDLYGLPYRASSAVVAGDFYHGSYDGDTGATALQDDLCVLGSTLGAIESDATGDSNLATYLAAQYTAGATGGDYVFIRLSSDYVGVPNYKYYRFTTANDGTSTDQPVLTIVTSE